MKINKIQLFTIFLTSQIRFKILVVIRRVFRVFLNFVKVTIQKITRAYQKIRQMAAAFSHFDRAK